MYSCIQLDSELENRLELLAKAIGRSKNYHANIAIRKYLREHEDCLLGVAAFQRCEPRISLKELERDLGF